MFLFLPCIVLPLVSCSFSLQLLLTCWIMCAVLKDRASVLLLIRYETMHAVADRILDVHAPSDSTIRAHYCHVLEMLNIMRQCSEHHIGNVIDSRVYVNAANVVCRCLQLRNCITCLQHVLLYVICRAFRSLDCFKRFCHFATAAVFACSIVSSGWIWGYCCCIMDCIRIATLLAHALSVLPCMSLHFSALHRLALHSHCTALPRLHWLALHCLASALLYTALLCIAMQCKEIALLPALHMRYDGHCML